MITGVNYLLRYSGGKPKVFTCDLILCRQNSCREVVLYHEDCFVFWVLFVIIDIFLDKYVKIARTLYVHLLLLIVTLDK